MGRPKSYENSAEKQRAYRLRKMGEVGMNLGKEEAAVETDLGDSDAVSEDLSGVPAQGNPEIREPLRTSAQLTATDQIFEESKPRYWVYGKTVNVRHCGECGKKFETRMELNRFCGPKCKQDFLDKHFDTTKCEK